MYPERPRPAPTTANSPIASPTYFGSDTPDSLMYVIYIDLSFRDSETTAPSGSGPVVLRTLTAAQHAPRNGCCSASKAGRPPWQNSTDQSDSLSARTAGAPVLKIT